MKDTRRKVTVCDECLTAACWQGEFYCNRSREAGTVDLPVSTLENLRLENPEFWDKHGFIIDDEEHTNAPGRDKG